MRHHIVFLTVVFLWTSSLLAQQKTLNDYFPFAPPETRQQWEERRTELRRQMLVSQGLFPMPAKTDLKPIIHHPIERDEFTVHGIILEVVPGYFLTGNLYVPKNAIITSGGKVPGVLCPHGHWNGGRFYHQSEAAFAKELETGAEKYDPSGRYPLQARCITLARLGCVVFHYDMIGYADSVQFQHRPGVREAMNTKEDWGFFSPQAELRLQHMMGLQTLGSIRALDWLEILPQVDAKRIAVTGASGGGTQSFILSAVDDRVAVSFPAVMVSTAMQGGCTCENSCYLRVGTGNIEIAALFAPKPQGMTAADDWTKEMETKGFPQLKQLYALFDVEKNVALFPHIQYPHNYNFPSRADMYRFMNEHLKLGHTFGDEPIEKPFVPLTVEEMTVWNDEHPKPAGDQVGEVFERKLLREMNERSNAQLAALPPQERNEIVRNALKTMIDWKAPRLEDVNVVLESFTAAQVPNGWKIKGQLTDKRSELTVPFVALASHVDFKIFKEICVFVSKNGVTDYFNEDGKPIDEIAKMISSAEKFVIILDLHGQGGEHPLEKVALGGYADGSQPWQKSLAYTYGYNPSVFAKRVQNLLTILTVSKKKSPEQKITLVGIKGGASYAAVARALLGDAVDMMFVDTEGFRFANIESLDDVNMLPGIVKYGDLPAILTLSDPKKTEIRGEK
ncbi:MAG: acetylxylan esterase [Planctomycetaceae bacterium]|nr:acetylxylan esterase [Planctomycetaceae bacterium]